MILNPYIHIYFGEHSYFITYSYYMIMEEKKKNIPFFSYFPFSTIPTLFYFFSFQKSISYFINRHRFILYLYFKYL